MQPNPFTQTPPDNVTVHAQVVPGHNGDPMLALVFGYGYSTLSLVINDTAATQLAAVLPEVLTKSAAEIRRIRSGLIVPGPGIILPPNGRTHQ